MLCIMHEKDLKAFLVFIPGEDSLKISFLLDWFNAVFTDRVSMFGVFEWVFLPLPPPFLLRKRLGNLSTKKDLTNQSSVYT